MRGSLPEIKAAVGSPDQNLVDVDNALEGLSSSCFYLNWERNRYRFGMSPNLNQILVTRRGSVAAKAIEDRIREQTRALFDKNTTDASKQIDRNYFPARSNDVPSRPVLTLGILGLDQEFGEKGTISLVESIIRDCGTSGRTYKSALLFAAPDSGDAVRDAARNLLAWEDIDEDEDTKKRVDDAQRSLLARNLANAKRDLSEAIFRVYRHVLLLGKDNKLQHVDLGQITSSSAASPVELILRELGRVDVITEGVSPNKLLKYWPPALIEWSTQSVRDAFYSSPQLPRLLNVDAVKRAIGDGVTQGIFGYASKDANGTVRLEKLKESLFEGEVEIADDVCIIKASDAQKLLEPPRLVKLQIRPEQVMLKPGEQASFSLSALDQYGQPVSSPDVSWSGTGGAVSPEGLYTAGETGGLHAVCVESNGHEARADVRIVTDDEPATPPPPSGQQMLRWRGTLPPQKWMNFYTKVLTRFASNPDLRLDISFEVPVDRGQAQAKANETRSGLKELGLGDDVRLNE